MESFNSGLINSSRSDSRRNAGSQPPFSERMIIDETMASIPFLRNDHTSQVRSLTCNDIAHIEAEKFRTLEEELEELFEVSRNVKKSTAIALKGRSADLVQKMSAEKEQVQRRLEEVQQKLFAWEKSSIKTDDQKSTPRRELDLDELALITSLRERWEKLSHSYDEMKNYMKKLKAENENLCLNFESNGSMSQRNDATLKEIAIALAEVTGRNVDYGNMYFEPGSSKNPFVQAIVQMNDRFRQCEHRWTCEATTLKKEIGEFEEALQNKKSHINEDMKCEIEHLRCALIERDQTIGKLNTLLSRQSNPDYHTSKHNEIEIESLRCQLAESKHRIENLLCEINRSQRQEQCETKNLNDALLESKHVNNELNTQICCLEDELSETKRANNDLNMRICRLEEHRTDLLRRNEMLQSSLNDQTEKLRAASAENKYLHDRCEKMDRKTSEHGRECDVLREQVYSHREKEAALTGENKSLGEQIGELQKEIVAAQEAIRRHKCIIQNNNGAHAEEVKQLREQLERSEEELNSVKESYRQLECDMRLQTDSIRQRDEVLKSFQIWKKEQIEADQINQKNFKKYEEHIRLMLEEKQTYLDRYRELHRDYTILQNEMDRLRLSSFSSSFPEPIRGHSADQSREPDRLITEGLQRVRRANIRLSERSHTLRADNTATCDEEQESNRPTRRQ